MVTSCFPPSSGGIERCTYELSRRLSEFGHHVTVVTSSRGLPRRIYHQSTNIGDVIRYPEYPSIIEIPFVPQIPLRLLLDRDYDVIHVHGMTPTQTDLALFLSRFSRAKKIYTHHYDPETRGGRLTNVYSYIGRENLRNADEIVASTLSYAQTSRFLSPFIHRTKIIPMGVDVNRFGGTQTGPEIAQILTPFQFKKTVLYVGKLIYYKGIEYLLWAFSKLATDDAGLIVVGRGHEEAALRQLADKLGVSKRVAFLGTVPEPILPSIYSSADVVVLPSISRREAFGIVLLEAMASGKPVIASDIPGVRDVVDDGRTGYLVPPRDPASIARALTHILSEPKIARRLGAEARAKATRYYDWNTISITYEKIYTE